MKRPYAFGFLALALLVVGVPLFLSSTAWAPEDWNLFVVLGFPLFLGVVVLLLIASALGRVGQRHVAPLMPTDWAYLALHVLVVGGLVGYVGFYFDAA